jgi:hypothetical protein
VVDVSEDFKKNFDETIRAISDKFDKELFEKTQGQLEDYWHFKWNDSESIPINIYEFHGMLELYRKFCRRWEEHHNGSCCVVERVRDKYLMPKIQEFWVELWQRAMSKQSEEKGGE